MNKWLRYGLVYGFYMLLLLIVTQPLITQFDQVLIGAWESDVHEYVRHIWWYGYALFNGEPLFHHTYLGYPDGLSAWWLWAIPLQSFPAVLFALVMPLPAAYNLMVLLRLALNGWATFYFVRRLLNGTHTDAPVTRYANEAALLAGVVFMLYPAMQGQLFGSHAGLLALWGVPLYVDALLRLRDHTRLRDYVRVAVFFVASLLGSSLLLIHVLLPLTLYVGIARLLNREWRWLWRCVMGATGGLVLSMVFILPAFIEQTFSEAAVRAGGAVFFGPDLLSIITPSFFNPLFTDLTYSRTVLGTSLVEGVAYVGVVAAILMGIGVWRFRAAWGWLVMIGVTWMFSLSPLLKVLDEVVTMRVGEYVTHIPTPSALFGFLPVFSSIRTPGRFNLVIGLGVAVLAAYGAAWLLERMRGASWPRRVVRYTVVVGLMVAIVFDYQLVWDGWQPTVATIPAKIPDGIAALREDDSINVVMNMPYAAFYAKEALYLQTAHQKPLIAGYIARTTPVNTAKLDVLQSTLDPALLNAAGADAVILFREWSAELSEHIYAGLGEPFYESERLAVFRVPETDDAPGFHVVSHIEDVIEDDAPVYVHAPEPAWVLLEMTLSGEARDFTVRYEGTPVYRGTVDGESTFNVPVLLEAGYSTVSVALEPPCPDNPPHPTLVCSSVQVENVAVGEPAAVSLPESIPFERGLTLQNAHVDDDLSDGVLDVWLSWDVAQATNEDMVRFVQVLNAADESVAADDTPPGVIPAGEAHNERLSLALPDDLPPGEYRVYTGWYTYPDLARLAVQSDVEGSINNWVLLDTVTVR